MKHTIMLALMWLIRVKIRARRLACCTDAAETDWGLFINLPPGVKIRLFPCVIYSPFRYLKLYFFIFLFGNEEILWWSAEFNCEEMIEIKICNSLFFFEYTLTLYSIIILLIMIIILKMCMLVNRIFVVVFFVVFQIFVSLVYIAPILYIFLVIIIIIINSYN